MKPLSRIVVSVVILVVIVAWLFPVRGRYFYPILITVGGFLIFAWLRLSRAADRLGASRGRFVPKKGEFLCDTCKYNHPNDCSRRERPNATVCEDYRER